jgi:hypothetical protein
LYTGQDNQLTRFLAELTADELAEILVTSAVDVISEPPSFAVQDDSPPQVRPLFLFSPCRELDVMNATYDLS